jgi:rfaE bifunctional protein kinase chain/domain
MNAVEKAGSKRATMKPKEISVPQPGRANDTIPRVLVLGDVILDEYWHGCVERISPEAPVPVLNVASRQRRPGGAGNVALSLKALGCEVICAGFIGDDEPGEWLIGHMAEWEIECHLRRLSHRTTPHKIRLVASNQQMIRADVERVEPATKNEIAPLTEVLSGHYSAVIVSDYGKGNVQTDLMAAVRSMEHPCPIIVDPKGRDWRLYQGVTAIKPNQAEISSVTFPSLREGSLLERAEELREELGIDAVLLSLGKDGVALLEKGRPPLSLLAYPRDLVDVTGAGDTLCAGFTWAIAKGLSMSSAVALANLAAGVSVSKFGAATASLEEIHDLVRRNPRIQVHTIQSYLKSDLYTRGNEHPPNLVKGDFDRLDDQLVEDIREWSGERTSPILVVCAYNERKTKDGLPLELQAGLLASLPFVQAVVIATSEAELKQLENTAGQLESMPFR